MLGFRLGVVSPNGTGFSKEDKQQVTNLEGGQTTDQITHTHGDTKSSPRAPTWEGGITKEVDSLQVLEWYGLPSCNSVYSPESGSDLSIDSTDDTFLDAAGLEMYQTIVESLLYLGQVTRYDIAYTVKQLSRASNKPAPTHTTTAKCVLRCIAGNVTWPSGSRGDCLDKQDIPTPHSPPTGTDAAGRHNTCLCSAVHP